MKKIYFLQQVQIVPKRCVVLCGLSAAPVAVRAKLDADPTSQSAVDSAYHSAKPAKHDQHNKHNIQKKKDHIEQRK
jgi:hypothetical protein